MYTLVLLTALAPGADVTPPPVPVAVAPAVVAGCSGCTGYSCTGYGCSGSSVGSCYGSGYGSCTGSCHGGLFGHKRGGGLFGHKHSCHGCCGGGGYSCSGWNCFGSCTGSGYGGCYGSAWGSAGTMPPYSLQGYGYGYAPSYADPAAVYGTVTNMNPVPVVPVPVPVPVDTKSDTKKSGSDDTKKGTGTDDTKKGMGASIKFRLPADAKLFVDGRLTTLSGAERAFTTPPLTEGKFFYDVKAELLVNGLTVVEQKRVVVEAGSDLTESFPVLFAALEKPAEAVAGK